MGEMKGFVFALTFIVIFSTFLGTIPVGLQGDGLTAQNVIPANPSLVTAFDDYENFTYSAGGMVGPIWQYQYGILAKIYVCQSDNSSYFMIGKKVLFWGLWLGEYDIARFTSDSGTNRGTQLSWTEIETDATGGSAWYNLQLETSGDDAGSFLIYWNITLYPTVSNAWGNDSLYLLHGIGQNSTSTNNALSLVLGLLTLQIPNVPVLINTIIVVPMWACIIYLIWFIIKETIPFV